MNYAKMIEVMEWVKAARKDREEYALGTSPYICDNIQRYPGEDDESFKAKAAIRQDIRERLDFKFGVPEFLGFRDEDGIDNNDFPEVHEFRANLIEELIQSYKDRAL